MAKDDNNTDSTPPDATAKVAKDKNKKGKKSGCLIPILVLVVLVGGLVAVVVLNLFGARDLLAGMVSNVPVLNELIPATSEGDGEENQSASRRASREYEAQIAELMEEVDTLNERIQQLNERSSLYLADINRLQQFEDQQVQFREDKEEFDRMIAENDQNAFARFYEDISPENAERLYREAVVANVMSAELRNYVTTITAMEEAVAARILEQLLPADMDLVVLILRNIDIDARGLILGAMSPTNAADVYKQLAPEESL